MTIDEAIAHAREVAKNKMAEYQNHYDKDAHYYPRQCTKCAEEHEQLAEWLEELKAIKDNCDGKCTNCSNTELPNIKDCKEMDIGYSYAYKTDCAGDRYIKAEEVKYLLKCERGKAIDDFVKLVKEHNWNIRNRNENEFIYGAIDRLAGELKAGGENEN